MCLSSLKPAPTGSPLPWPLQEDITHTTFHPPTQLSCVHSALFKASCMHSGKPQGVWDVLKHSEKPSYFDVQRHIQEGLVGIRNCFAAAAHGWKANGNAQQQGKSIDRACLCPSSLLEPAPRSGVSHRQTAGHRQV